MQREVNVFDAIQERIERDGFDALTDAERYYHAIWWLEGQTSNGSFHQFFANAPGSWAFDAVAGLSAIGATKMAALVDVAINLFPARTIPDDDEERHRILDAMTEAQEESMDRLSGQFTDYPEDLEKLLEKFVLACDADFRGPRTLLDLWKSKHQRGADTVPSTVRKIDFAIEAERDRPYSSRPCPVCDYPSPNYRNSCKRCGFPHSKVES